MKLSEKAIEGHVFEAFARRGFLTVKTEAGKSGARLPTGFPDAIALLPLTGTPFALVVLSETKTRSGKLNPKQTDYHALLRSYGLQPQIVRSAEDAESLAQEGRRVRRLLLPLLKKEQE